MFLYVLSIDAVHVFLLVVKEISIIFIPKQILMIQITNKISRLLLVFLVSNLIAVNMYAGIIGGCPDNENGKWNEGKRSVSSDIPITIYVENGQLVIKSHSLRSDITIRIMDSSTMVYEETVLAEKTGYILIDLKDNKSGVYTLNLTNQWGDHLYGEFTLE
ncbi:DUF3244 domain-containing protein [Parabacteroides distasonis]|uniref:DUF3244 domain-containing protein n=3 Tax=Tannerellaceae TaxID=2005525 RepID=A0A1Y4IFI3_PARDI|nr:hypothetical protein HMPREF0619_00510 [Parabacteroides sp. D13]EEY83892.1 hypothetical protein HMPREF0103_2133 [Bacteroides sp. 2_1_33B]MBM6558041.1 DUF3244 domain-containing protein [Parabacteroides distasonis]RLT70003.1 DUF3244 domain-containing protein [Parabacteroides sp. CH2-D42-20]OUP15632.1 hypothetical protein B5F32_16870 [Parabacteroides distasonis]